mgnify:CR=1 FL=1
MFSLLYDIWVELVRVLIALQVKGRTNPIVYLASWVFLLPSISALTLTVFFKYRNHHKQLQK